MKYPQHYLTEMQEVILFYNGLDVPTRQIFDLKGAIPTKTVAEAKVAIQEMAKYSQKWHNGTSRTRSTETSDGLAAIQAQLNNLRREIKKVNEKVYVVQVGCEQCKGPHYTKDCPLKEEGKTLEEASYTQFGAPFQQGGQYRATALGFYQRNNANPSYQERRQSMEESLSKSMCELAKRHEENSNLIKEIRASTDAAIRNQGASIKTLKIQIGKMSKVLQEKGFGSLPSSTETNPRDHVKSISTTVEADMTPICRIGSSQHAVSAQQNSKLMYESRRMTIPFPNRLNDCYYDEKKGSYGLQCLDAYSYGATRVDDSLPRKEKDPGSFTLPCYINNVCFDNAFADLGASVSVMPLSTYLNLGLCELAHTKLTVELADRTVKYPKGIAENVQVGIGKFVFLIDFIILDMPEDVKVPLIIGRPFLSTVHAKIDVFKRKITLRVGDKKIIFKSMKPASSLIKRVYLLSLRESMELDLEARLMGETLVLNRSLDPLYGDYIELNDFNVPLGLSRDQVDDLMPTIKEGEDKVKYKGKNVVEDFMNVPIFVRNFSVVTHFAVVENMDGYRDQDMGDIIFREPFCKASCVEARRTLPEKKSTKLVKYRSSGILLVMEYLVKISKKARILELKRRHLKITDSDILYVILIKEDMAYIIAVIMEYLVKDSKRRAFWSLNEDILEITILKTNTPYPSRKIRRIRHHRPQRNKDQYAISKGLNTPYSRYGINIIFWKISSVVPTLRNP
ncbi:mitochondrial proton/calcium exchanger protein-like protein isoform X1 [Tanacetum coccineum]|uniref:Mitochondrial proton/calcium exchanger protein-like protein isoform X1 n=1 Tax=Tanacetum coccineum TaxID=301880 RepID=A0ABQ5GJ55_9ASTR